MIQLNDAQHEYRPGLSLAELVEEHNARYDRKLDIEEFLVLVDGHALSTKEAKEKTVNDNERIRVIPILSGG